MLFGFHFDMRVLYYPNCTSSALLTEEKSTSFSLSCMAELGLPFSTAGKYILNFEAKGTDTAQLFPEFPLALCIVKSDLCYTSADQLTLHKHLSSVSDICYQSEIKYLSKSIINIQDTTLAIRSLLKLINPDSLDGKFPRPKIIWLIVLWHSIYMMKY